jgi:hypothetical protein
MTFMTQDEMYLFLRACTEDPEWVIVREGATKWKKMYTVLSQNV